MFVLNGISPSPWIRTKDLYCNCVAYTEVAHHRKTAPALPKIFPLTRPLDAWTRTRDPLDATILSRFRFSFVPPRPSTRLGDALPRLAFYCQTSQTTWPEAEVIANQCDNDELFLCFYREMRNRHMFATTNVSRTRPDLSRSPRRHRRVVGPAWLPLWRRKLLAFLGSCVLKSFA